MTKIVSTTRMLLFVRRHCRRHRITETRFSRETLGDVQFVAKLRQGRRPRRKTLVLAREIVSPVASRVGSAR